MLNHISDIYDLLCLVEQLLNIPYVLCVRVARDVLIAIIFSTIIFQITEKCVILFIVGLTQK